MGKYRQLIIEGADGWHLMSPSNPWEALRIAWMLWRHPNKVAALVGVTQEYTLTKLKPLGAPIAEEKYEELLRFSDQAEAWHRATQAESVRYVHASEVTDAQRAAGRNSPLATLGDMVLVWANEGDLCTKGTRISTQQEPTR